MKYLFPLTLILPIFITLPISAYGNLVNSEVIQLKALAEDAERFILEKRFKDFSSLLSNDCVFVDVGGEQNTSEVGIARLENSVENELFVSKEGDNSVAGPFFYSEVETDAIHLSGGIPGMYLSAALKDDAVERFYVERSEQTKSTIIAKTGMKTDQGTKIWLNFELSMENKKPVISAYNLQIKTQKLAISDYQQLQATAFFALNRLVSQHHEDFEGLLAEDCVFVNAVNEILPANDGVSFFKQSLKDDGFKKLTRCFFYSNGTTEVNSLSGYVLGKFDLKKLIKNRSRRFPEALYCVSWLHTRRGNDIRIDLELRMHNKRPEITLFHLNFSKPEKLSADALNESFLMTLEAKPVEFDFQKAGPLALEFNQSYMLDPVYAFEEFGSNLKNVTKRANAVLFTDRYAPPAKLISSIRSYLISSDTTLEDSWPIKILRHGSEDNHENDVKTENLIDYLKQQKDCLLSLVEFKPEKIYHGFTMVYAITFDKSKGHVLSYIDFYFTSDME